MVALHGRATRAHRTFGLRTLGQPNLRYFSSYVIRIARGTHQGAPRAAGVTERRRATAADMSRSSAASTASSKGWERSGSGQKGVVRRPQARRGVDEVQNVVEQRRGE
jgi:hypothetical protein